MHGTRPPSAQGSSSSSACGAGWSAASTNGNAACEVCGAGKYSGSEHHVRGDVRGLSGGLVQQRGARCVQRDVCAVSAGHVVAGGVDVERRVPTGHGAHVALEFAPT